MYYLKLYCRMNIINSLGGDIGMNEIFEYKSIRLNNEMHLIGDLLYTACSKLHDLGTNIKEYELVPIFYNLSIGIERLQKVIILVEQEGINKNPKTHQLTKLAGIIHKKTNLELEKIEYSFLKYLTSFYESSRYLYFDKKKDEGYVSLIAEINKYFNKFGKPVIRENEFIGFDIDENVKLILKDTVSSIIISYIQLLKKMVNKENIYTMETESETKLALLIFASENVFEYFHKRDIAIGELMYFLTANINQDDDIPKLDFDSAEIGGFLSSINSNRMLYQLIEFVEDEYIEMDIKLERLNERKDLMINYFKIMEYFR